MSPGRATTSSPPSRAPTWTRWPTTTTASRDPPSCSAKTAARASSCAARPSRTCMPETYRVGLLGHGTVGAAFERLLGERASAVEHLTGRRPEITGVLTRSTGDFEEILENADLIVEVIGGIEAAREYVLDAMR